MESKDVQTIANRKVRFSFDHATGRLVGVRNRLTGNECLQGKAQVGNIFRVYYDFAREFQITAPKGTTPFRAAMPSDICRRAFSPSRECAVSFQQRRTRSSESLRITYADKTGGWLAKITVTMKGSSQSSIWTMSLTNTGDAPAELMCSFPLISGLKLGTGKRNLMVVNDQAGYILPLWSSEGGIYGIASRMSMQWGCVFDEASGDAFAFIVRDPQIRNKQIRYTKPSIEVSYFPPRLLQPGQTVSFPDVQIMVYTGDWKKAAVSYSQWSSRHFKAVKHAEWVRDMDGHGSGWFEKRCEPRPKRYPRVAHPIGGFEELPDLYRLLPVDNQEYAFHCRRSMPEEVTGKSMVHTDGDHVLREDLGGAKALRKGIRGVHDLGFHFTFYVEGYLCLADADIVLKGEGREWAVMNRDGTNDGSYTREGKKITSGWLHMCPGAAGWQDHIARAAARLVRETGADGVRLDSLGFYSFPCYNPAHNHESPFDYSVWVRQMLGKVAAAVKKENPRCLLTTEAGPDFFAPYFDGCLTQQWGEHKVAITRDVSPMRVAVPGYAVLVHCPCGPVAASLMGYPGGSGSVIETPTRMLELDFKWRSVRFPGAEVIRWGNAAHDNPVASRRDVVCRRFSSDTMEVIVGARPKYPADAKNAEALNWNIDIKRGKVAYSVTLDSGRRTPRRVFVWDVEKLSVKEVEPMIAKGKTSFEVNANWFMAILAYRGCRPIAQMDLPLRVKRGSDISVRSVLLGASAGSKLEGKLFAPALGFKRARTVNVPGTLGLRVPESLPPGRYLVQLRSDRFLGYRRFLEVCA